MGFFCKIIWWSQCNFDKLTKIKEIEIKFVETANIQICKMTRNCLCRNYILWKFWLNSQVLLPRKLRRCTSTWNPMKKYCQTVYYCANTFLFCFTSNHFIIFIIKINRRNDLMFNFELDLHCYLSDSQLWLNKTWLMIWYMTPQSNRWNVNKQTLERSNVCKHLCLLCYPVLCCY